MITDATRAVVPIRHPEELDLGFRYGTILTDDAVAGSEHSTARAGASGLARAGRFAEFPKSGSRR